MEDVLKETKKRKEMGRGRRGEGSGKKEEGSGEEGEGWADGRWRKGCLAGAEN